MIIQNDLSEITRVTEAIHAFSEQSKLASEVDLALQLVVEELLTNMIQYGFPDNAPHTITLDLQAQPGEVSLLVRDDGIPFNLLEYPVPKRAATLDEMNIGGLGIHLVRRTMDEITYCREDSWNTLVLKKRLDTR